jgi:hypothetical protein
MPELVSVSEAARELKLNPSRVRSLIADGSLRADKVAGRWLVHSESVAARMREPMPPGRPMAARNVWAMLLVASGEPFPDGLDPAVRWRLRQALAHQGLVAVRGRLDRRADIERYWALPGELRALRKSKDIVLSGSSAAGVLDLPLAAPDAIDAYVRASRKNELIREFGLEEIDKVGQDNVILRAVPDNAWMLDDRSAAPVAAVALDLSFYPDSRSARIGNDLLKQADKQARAA